jgi:hypothetical protein
MRSGSLCRRSMQSPGKPGNRHKTPARKSAGPRIDRSTWGPVCSLACSDPQKSRIQKSSRSHSWGRSTPKTAAGALIRRAGAADVAAERRAQDVVLGAPNAPAHHLIGPRGRPRRIAARRAAVLGLTPPVIDPFQHVVGHVQRAVRAGPARVAAYRAGVADTSSSRPTG